MEKCATRCRKNKQTKYAGGRKTKRKDERKIERKRRQEDRETDRQTGS